MDNQLIALRYTHKDLISTLQKTPESMAAKEEASPSRRYRGDIDGLRAVAILLVILYHSGMHFFQGGYTGVDIFFVISGYLIGGQIYSDKRDGVFSYWSFYYRRARRILPALFVVVAVISLITIYSFPPTNLRDYGETVSFVALSASNLYFLYRRLAYFAPQPDLNSLLMTWSLGVEEQFYLAIPVIISWLLRMRRKIGMATLVVVSLLSLCLWIFKGSGPVTFYFLPARFWELGVGVILAILTSDRDSAPFEKGVSNAAGSAGALLLCVPLLTVHSNIFPPLHLLPSVIGTVLLIAAPSSWINGRILASGPARFIGKISYSWYLWHWPLLALLRFYSVDTPPPALIASVIAISLCVAVVSYFVVEQPIRKKSQPAIPAVIRYGALCLAIAAGGICLKESHGIPQRFPNLAGLSRDRIRMESDSCLVGGDQPNLSSKCYSATGAHPVVAIWGDSHAAALSAGLRGYVNDRGYDFDQLTIAACSPLPDRMQPRQFGAGNSACFRFNETSLDRIATDGRVRIVIIAFNWKRIFQGDSMNRCATEDCFAYLESSIRRLQSYGKKVIVMEDVPEFDVDPVPSAYFQNLRAWPVMARVIGIPHASEFGILSKESQALADRTEIALSQAVNELSGVQYVRLHDLFCGESGCRFSQDGKILYIDEHHLSTAGANLALTRLRLNR